MYSKELQKLIVHRDGKEVLVMYDIIYLVLKRVDLNNAAQINVTLKHLENLLENIIPDIYFCRQRNEYLVWTIKSLSLEKELCQVIIGKSGFEII